MMPPVGVQASVLSYDTIKVTWADNSLPKNQKITDNRFYTVRWKTNIPANTKVKVRVVVFALELQIFTGKWARNCYEILFSPARETLAACFAVQANSVGKIFKKKENCFTLISLWLRPIAPAQSLETLTMLNKIIPQQSPAKCRSYFAHPRKKIFFTLV